MKIVVFTIYPNFNEYKIIIKNKILENNEIRLISNKYIKNFCKFIKWELINLIFL